MHILLVEDDNATRELMQTYLCDESQGMICDAASSVAEALAMLDKTKYNLLILDLMIRGETCIPIVLKAKMLWPDNPPAICIVSAMRNAEKIANDNGVFSFVKKPFSLDSIDEIVVRRKLQM